MLRVELVLLSDRSRGHAAFSFSVHNHSEKSISPNAKHVKLIQCIHSILEIVAYSCIAALFLSTKKFSSCMYTSFVPKRTPFDKACSIFVNNVKLRRAFGGHFGTILKLSGVTKLGLNSRSMMKPPISAMVDSGE